ncbi:MAG TPA: hypothetical protein VML55_16545, partial [Planctomycetaceae bacterium]|nr:hypothetical protein [Planctomycetaceae bacterium]
MADGLSVHCPECGAGLKLKDRSRVGKQVRCPGCRAAFVVPAPAESADTTDLLDDDLWVDEEPGESGVGPSPRRAPARRPRRSPAGLPRSAPRGGSRVSRASAAPSRPLGMNPVVLCCAAGTALLLGAAILFAVLRGMRHDPSAEQERLARSAEQAQQRFVAPGVPRPAGNGAPPQISDEMAEMYAQVSREEAATFAREFVTAVSNRDAAAVDRLIYYDFLLYQAASGVNANQSIRQAFTDGYKQSPNRHVLLNHIARALEAGGTIEPVRIHVHRAVTNEGVSLARRVLMRLLDADGGVAYFDLSLERHTDGSIRANDWFDVGAGELFSEALKRSFIMVVGSRTTNPQVSQEQRELTESAARILQIRSLAAAGQAREALQIIDGLPASVRNS